MSHQEGGGETRLALQNLKRPKCAQNEIAVSIPRTLASPGPTFNMLPFMRGFQDNMMSWMNRLINQQDGCLQIVALLNKLVKVDFGKNKWHKTVTMNAPKNPSRTEIKFKICVPNLLTGKHKWSTSGQNEILILSKKKSCWLTCVYSAAKPNTGSPEWLAKQNKLYAKTLQRLHKEPLKCEKPWTDNFRPVGGRQKQNSGICMSPTALKHTREQSARK